MPTAIRPLPALLLMAALMAGLAACSDDSSPAGPDGDDTLPAPEQQTIDAAGGSFDFFAGLVRLQFWPGSVADGTLVTVSPQHPDPADPALVAGTCFAIGPDSLAPSTAFGLHLALPAGRAAQLAGHKIHRLDGDQWTPVSSFVLEEHLLTWIDGPGTYALRKMVDGLVYVGNFNLYEDSQLPALVGYEGITGNLGIIDEGLTRLEGLESLRWIGGNLFIDDCPNVTSIGALGALERVDLNLHVVGSGLHSLVGLGALQAVGGDVQISWNDSLRSLGGLGALSDVGRRVFVDNNATLQGLSGLAGLARTQGEIKIAQNEQLSSLSGLQPARTQGIIIDDCDRVLSLAGLRVPGDCDGLMIHDCDGLRTLEGIVLPIDLPAVTVQRCDSLTSLAGLGTLGSCVWLTVSNNDALTSLSGLHHLTAVQGLLILDSNPELVDLAGLSLLQSVGGLKIVDCDALVDLDGLAALRKLGWYGFATSSFLDLSYNDALADITALHELMVNPGTGYAIPENVYCRHNLLISEWHIDQLVTALGGLAVIGGEIILE